MPTFTKYTHLFDGVQSIEFAPGDVVPDWALGKVTNRVATGPDSESSEGSSDSAESEGFGETVTAEDSSEDGAEGSENDETEAVEESGEPDFTKPAPAKRGRPRKTQG